MLLGGWQLTGGHPEAARGQPAEAGSQLTAGLAEREAEVLGFDAMGQGNQLIARERELRDFTVISQWPTS